MPALAWAAVIFWTSSQSEVPLVPRLFVGADKLIHAAVYATLCGLLLWAAQAVNAGVAFVWVAITALYGASDEIHQIWVPQRSSDVLDWLADAAGAVLAAAAWLKLKAGRSAFHDAGATGPRSR